MLQRIFSFALLLGITISAAAASPPAQDPRAMAIVNQSLQALSGGRTAFIDATLQAMATYAAGSDIENGTATLEAKGNRESRVVLNLDGGEREEIRQGTTGAWVGPDGRRI